MTTALLFDKLSALQGETMLNVWDCYSVAVVLRDRVRHEEKNLGNPNWSQAYLRHNIKKLLRVEVALMEFVLQEECWKQPRPPIERTPEEEAIKHEYGGALAGNFVSKLTAQERLAFDRASGAHSLCESLLKLGEVDRAKDVAKREHARLLADAPSAAGDTDAYLFEWVIAKGVSAFNKEGNLAWSGLPDDELPESWRELPR